MEKINLDVDIILPDVPDEKDACVQRIISSMETKRELRKFISWLKQTLQKRNFVFITTLVRFQ